LKHHEFELWWKKEEASVRRKEKLRRVSPEMKKYGPRVDEEPVSCTSGWAAQSRLRGGEC
jgi:hypothetical protein